MKRTIGLVASLAILSLIPATANAQRYRNGTVTTPFGQYSMREMQAAGGNPFQAESVREQRMAMLYQQQMIKQQQQYLQQRTKVQKAQQDYLKKHPEEASRISSAASSTSARARISRRTGSAASKKSAGAPAAAK